MIRNISLLILLSVLMSCASSNQTKGAQTKTEPDLEALSQKLLLKEAAIHGQWIEYTVNGKWKTRDKVNWLSGMVAGEHWIMYDLTGKEIHREKALEWTDRILPFANIDYTHDMGFIFLPTLVASWEHTGDPRYKAGIAVAAEMLAQRYNPNGRFIRAWGRLGSDEERAGWMIIDTMMNLELLFKAAEIFNNPEWYRVAYAHSLTTLGQSFRPDGSTYHVVEFDPHSGEVIKKRTHQGLGDETAWARGQAWAISGFSTAYRYTGDLRFKIASQKAAKYFFEHLNAEDNDFVPSWDLSLYQDRHAQKDASAAAVAAMGMLDLANQEQNPRTYATLENRAIPMVSDLLQNYTTLTSKRPIEEGLLAHTVYHYHKNWGVGESFPPGDYYFLRALQLYVEAFSSTNIDPVLLANDGRVRINANAKWTYQKAESMEGHGEIVDLPHTWNAFDVMDSEPGYRRGKGVYEKNMYISKALSDRRIALTIEAANTYAEVYVNNKLAGSHAGGYLGFSIDLTDYINLDANNTIRVEVDNSINPEIIPSQKSDFFIYGGLTRDVYFDILPASHISRIHISTPNVSAERGTVLLVANVESQVNDYSAKINAKLIDPSGKTIQTKSIDFTGSSNTGDLEIEWDPVFTPELWHPDSPAMYAIEVSILEGGKLVDQVKDSFGFRWFEFVENGPFLLNGKRLLLRGTHRHEEWAGYGNAMPDQLHRRDMELIKKMGGNFVRLAHYPQDPEVYKACDELGILVWDELPWCRGGVGNEVWRSNTQRLLEEMITQNFNHPSIIIWSLGNEIYWLPDLEGGGDNERLRSELSLLNDLAHTLDPSRVTAVRKYYEGADIVDVFSPSIWAGWYSGVYTNYPKAISDSQKKYKRFFHMEYGGASHVGRHDENPITGQGIDISDGWEEAVNQAKVKNVASVGDWSENYIVDLFDYHLSVSETAENFTGNAQWAMKDFGTPLRPENAIPYVNQKGLLDRSGKPKDAYYVFKSYWTSDPAFCYIESPTWTDRAGPKGKKRNVSVYSNCSELELFLNGVSLGRHTKAINKSPAQGLNWDLLFAEGPNTVVAKGYSDGTNLVCTDTLKVNYSYAKPGKPEEVALSWQDLPNGNVRVIATVVDGLGQRCLDYNDRLYFWSDKEGALVENMGTPGGSSIIECASGQASIEVRTAPGETMVIEARNQDFKGAYLALRGPEPQYRIEGN